MHRSAFSHGLTRPYPYPWFTWVAVVGGIAAAALFTVISFVANGFDTGLVSVTNPNETEHPSSPSWFQRPPFSLVSKISPKCQDQIFTVGSQIYTDGLLLSHQIRDLTHGGSGMSQRRKTLAYHHSSFQDCQVSRMTLAVEHLELNFTAKTTCTVYEKSVPVRVNLYTYVDSSQLDLIKLSRNDTSLPDWYNWGGAVVLSQLAPAFVQLKAQSNTAFWSARCDWFFTKPPSSADTMVSSQMSMTYQNTTLTALIGDVMIPPSSPLDDPSESLQQHTNVTLATWSSTFGLDALSLFYSFAENLQTYTQPLNYSNPAAAFALRADNLGKGMYSILNSDFGQSLPTNILASPQMLWNFFDRLDVMDKQLGGLGVMPWVKGTFVMDASYPVYEFNDTTRNDIATLAAWAEIPATSVKPSFLNTLYLCSVPIAKPVANMLFVVIVADLVFLQTLWTLFNLVVTFFLERHDKTANHCSGCAELTSMLMMTTSLTSPSNTSISDVKSLLSNNDFHAISTDEPPVARSRPTGEVTDVGTGTGMGTGLKDRLFRRHADHHQQQQQRSTTTHPHHLSDGSDI